MTLIPFTGARLNRTAHRRSASEGLSAAWRAPESGVCVLKDGAPLVEDTFGTPPHAGPDGPPARTASLAQSEAKIKALAGAPEARLAWISAPDAAFLEAAPRLFLGEDNSGASLFAVDASYLESPDEALAAFGEFANARAALSVMSEFDLECVGAARAIFHWRKRNQFCANCGERVEITLAGWRADCPACQTQHFPKIDPVAIMLPVDGDQCLLARKPGWPDGFYSCLAGFVEPGETFEQAAIRETLEEVGLKSAAAPDYLFGQPWPFPSSLMMGMILKVQPGPLTLEPGEIETAQWVSRSRLCKILAGEDREIYAPPALAIAHHILSNWAARG